jgi:biopolymer transport protein TolR
MKKTRLRRRPMSDINVVPYIDVMLVLLVIFMVTAPLITQGVKVELPQADAEVISNEASEPVVITVDQFGDLYVDVGEDKNQPIDPEDLMVRIRAVLKYRPDTPIMVKGDAAVSYGRVVQAMVLAQAAGAPSVGLITTPPEHPKP